MEFNQSVTPADGDAHLILSTGPPPPFSPYHRYPPTLPSLSCFPCVPLLGLSFSALFFKVEPLTLGTFLDRSHANTNRLAPPPPLLVFPSEVLETLV